MVFFATYRTSDAVPSHGFLPVTGTYLMVEWFFADGKVESTRRVYGMGPCTA